MTIKEEMIKFLREKPLPIYFEERQTIEEFIETFFAYYEEEPLK